jgi:ubiquinone/menaquinone biosynthesis C-methylase UbiE/DNA-binding HxlR family transcriptional regulator
MTDMVGVLRAAGESTRLRLLALLADGEHSVKDLTEILAQSQPRVSRHLKLLADAGLVERHAEGAWAYYRIAPSGAGAELAHWLAARIEPGSGPLAQDRRRQAEIRAAQQEEAAAYFAGVARDWDQWRALHVPEVSVEAAIVAEIDGPVRETLIDLGTGSGRMLELLAGRYRHGLGLDSSREMLAVARARLAAAGLTHARVRHADIADLDPGIGPADLVVLHQVLHYFDDPGRILAQAARLLAPGGEILVVDFAPHAHEFLREKHAHRRLGLSRAQMRGWADAAGLAEANYRDFPPADGAGLTVCLWRLAPPDGK